MQAACLRFDAEANTYTYIDGASYNTDKTMTVDLPKAGFYAFVSASASVSIPLPTLYAEARVTSSTSVKTISYAGGELTLGVQTTTNNKITCTKKSNGTAEDPMHKRSIGTFFDIELDTEEKVKKGEIKYKYDSTTVAAVRTPFSLYIHVQASTHTHTHVFYLSLSLSFSLVHTHKYIHTRTVFLVQCTLPQFLCMQMRVWHTHTHVHTFSLGCIHSHRE